jgi:hypothetical protein
LFIYLEKMFKEFPYYDRCKPIFDSSSLSDSPAVQQDIAPAEHADNPLKSSQNELNILKPEPTHMINNSSPPSRSDIPHPSPLRAPQQHQHEEEYQALSTDNKRFVGTNAPESSYKKRRQNQQTLARPLAVYQPPPSLQPMNGHHITR